MDRERYFNFVKDLCEAASTPELYGTITKIYTLCESADDSTSEEIAKASTSTPINYNGISDDAVEELQGDLSKTADENAKIAAAKQNIAQAANGGTDQELDTAVSEYNTAKTEKSDQTAEMVKKLDAANAASQQNNQ